MSPQVTGSVGKSSRVTVVKPLVLWSQGSARAASVSKLKCWVFFNIALFFLDWRNIIISVIKKKFLKVLKMCWKGRRFNKYNKSPQVERYGKRGGRGPVLGNNTGKDCSDRYKENQSKADPDTSTTHVVVSSSKGRGQVKQNRTFFFIIGSKEEDLFQLNELD